MSQLASVLILAVIVITFGSLLVLVGALLGPKVKTSKAHRMAYECGLEGQASETTRISVKFYLTAILFILFDIEIIFMYPWALAYSEYIQAGYGLYILLAMGVFLAVFTFGLMWEIKSRALEWE